MDEIELDMELLGATAIEDKLQRGVPDTIARLARAGVSIWVLTGDKEETAVNIGFACQLLNRSMRRMHFNGKYVGGPDKGKLKTGAVLKAEIMKAYRGIQSIPEAQRNIQSLVIDGAALELVFPNSNNITPEARCDDALLEQNGSLRNCVLALANLCKAVVACRVSPKQKSLMVNLIKINTKGIKTLAIGDGANDVPMIQAAHVGVGISGQEGMQAVNASDFAIGQFAFLGRLLLVHGRWNYRRMSKLVGYMFYKNIVLCIVPFLYTFLGGYSGQQFMPELSGVQIFNIIYTGMPVTILAILDQDVPDHQVRRKERKEACILYAVCGVRCAVCRMLCAVCAGYAGCAVCLVLLLTQNVAFFLLLRTVFLLLRTTRRCSMRHCTRAASTASSSTKRSSGDGSPTRFTTARSSSSSAAGRSTPPRPTGASSACTPGAPPASGSSPS